MEIFEGLIGNEDIKSTLGNAISKREFLHAYIIEGGSGTGRRTVARLASLGIINCDNDDMRRKILNDNCTDIRFFDAFKVDDIRKIKETLYESPTECEYKIYILNDVEKMNIKAQNALLISLEEPPKNVVFFLLCSDATALLETIRSRAQILRTKPLTADQIKAYLKKNNITAQSEEALNEIILSSRGSLGYVLDMLDASRADSLLKDRERAKDFALKLLSNDSSTVTTLSSLFNSTREKLKDLLALSLIVLRDLAIIKKAKNAPLCFFTSSKEALNHASKYSIQKILYTYSLIEGGIEALNSNSNIPNTLVSLITNTKKKGN
ncbi:MAG: hypothetical protein J6B45_02110 [Clostridia bacterium]|nr:hypothetical protein [Clostridia bacterium]